MYVYIAFSVLKRATITESAYFHLNSAVIYFFFQKHGKTETLSLLLIVFRTIHKRSKCNKVITLSFCIPPALPTFITKMKDSALGRYSISFSVTSPDPPIPGVSTIIVLS